MKPIRLPKRSKYGNVKTVIHGKTFDSKAEAEQYLVNFDRQAKGEISFLQIQVPFALVVNGQHICNYIADATFIEDGQFIVEDTKGKRTEVYRLKKKLLKALFGYDIREINVKSRGRRKRK